MDRQTARETVSLIALMIGEIMEDHVDSALAPLVPQPVDWAFRLTSTGEDISVLGRALSVISRRAETS